MKYYVLFCGLWLFSLKSCQSDLAHVMDETNIFKARLTRNKITITISLNPDSGLVVVSNKRKQIIAQHHIPPNTTFWNVRRPFRWNQDSIVSIQTNSTTFHIPIQDYGDTAPGEAQ